MASDQGGSVGGDEQTVDPTPKHKDDAGPVALTFVKGACVALVLAGAVYGGFLIFQAVDQKLRERRAPRRLAEPRRLPSVAAAEREPVPA